MMAMKQQGDDDNGKNDNNDKDKRVTLHNVTVSHMRGRVLNRLLALRNIAWGSL
jgi:hypothetical protein